MNVPRDPENKSVQAKLIVWCHFFTNPSGKNVKRASKTFRINLWYSCELTSAKCQISLNFVAKPKKKKKLKFTQT